MLQLGPPRETERADAARNRQLILGAAKRLILRDGVDAVTMDAVARDAGIGKGTVFRRFGSRALLMQALLNESEMEFQRSFIEGPPPLGPGTGSAPADPVERLVAFGRARLSLLMVQGELLRAAAASPGERYSSPALAAASLHISMLLRAAGVQGDIPVLTFNLMATLDAALVLHENRAQAISAERLAAGWEFLVRRATAPHEAARQHWA
jgi:AcrR family transcriptional regulator